MAKSGGIVAALLVATAGGGAAYYYFQGQNVGDRPEQLASAVPENALAVGYVTTDSRIWSKLDKFGTPEAQKLLGQSLQKLQKDLLAEEKIDYQKDIQPWLGNVMVAFFPKSEKTSEASTLLVSKVKDKISALNFLNQMKAKAKTPIKELDYKGTKIFTSGEGKKATYTSTLKDWVMVAGDQQTVEKSIDTINGAASFNTKHGNQFFASDNLGIPNPVASFYVDYGRMVQSIYQSTNQKIDPEMLKDLQEVKSLAGGVGIDDQGLRMKMNAQTSESAFKLALSPGKVLAHFPADTLFISSGNGIKQVWDNVQKRAERQPELKKSIDQLQQSFQQNTKLDLDKDILSWMGGEYAVAVVPVNKGPLQGFGVGISAVFDSTAKENTDRAIQGLKTLASANGLATADRKSNGKDITDLKAPISPDPIVSYGWLNDQSMFVSMSDMDIKEPLDQSQDFKDITGSLPQNNSGYLYFNFDRIVKVIETKLPPAQLSSIPPETMALLTSIKGLGATVRQESSTVKMEGLLLLKSAKN